MARVTTVGPRVAVNPGRRLASNNISDRRITGRALQSRRFNMWRASPYCAGCGQMVAYPDGFELDHDVPLHKGGEDSESNCVILCVYYDADGRKAGCHAEKTAADLRS